MLLHNTLWVGVISTVVGLDWNDLEAYQWLKKSAEQKYADAEKYWVTVI